MKEDTTVDTKYIIIIGVIAIAAIVYVAVKAKRDKDYQIAKAEAEREHRIEREKKEKAARVERELREAKEKREQEVRQAEARAQAARAAELAVYSFMRKHPDGKEDVRLVGKADEYAFAEIGQVCTVEQDMDHDQRYLVLVDDMTIGALPTIALRYAEKADKDPTELAVILTDVDYDVEKDRDIFTVYIA